MKNSSGREERKFLSLFSVLIWQLLFSRDVQMVSGGCIDCKDAMRVGVQFHNLESSSGFRHI